MVTAFSIFDFNDDKDRDSVGGGGAGSGPMCCMSVSVISASHVFDCPSGMLFTISSRIQPCLCNGEVFSVSGTASSNFHSGFDRFKEREQR